MSLQLQMLQLLPFALILKYKSFIMPWVLDTCPPFLFHLQLSILLTLTSFGFFWVCWVLFHLQAFAPARCWPYSLLAFWETNFSTFSSCIDSSVTSYLSFLNTSLSFTIGHSALLHSLLELIIICDYVVYLLFVTSLGPVPPMDCTHQKSVSFIWILSGWAGAWDTQFNQYLLNQWMNPVATQ